MPDFEPVLLRRINQKASPWLDGYRADGGYRAIVKATYAHQSITPAAEWLLDNFHVVDEQIREIRDDLPPGFYRKLPKLAAGPLE